MWCPCCRCVIEIISLGKKDGYSKRIEEGRTALVSACRKDESASSDYFLYYYLLFVSVYVVGGNGDIKFSISRPDAVELPLCSYYGFCNSCRNPLSGERVYDFEVESISIIKTYINYFSFIFTKEV